MNLLTYTLHLIGSGATAYVTGRNMRDPQTRPDMLAGLQLAESGSVPFLEALSQRAIAEGDLWLADKLTTHAQDERRHGQIFAHGLKQLNKQVIEFKTTAERMADSKPDERRRSPFFDAYYQGYDKSSLAPDRIDWLVFFASTHILELDACKDFVRMANALPDDLASINLRKGMLSIAEDEKGHAAYLLEAMHRRLPAGDVMALVDQWRSRKVDAMMAMVQSLLQKGSKFPSLARDGGVPSEMSDAVADTGTDSAREQIAA
jgi:rubrerythrin